MFIIRSIPIRGKWAPSAFKKVGCNACPAADWSFQRRFRHEPTSTKAFASQIAQTATVHCLHISKCTPSGCVHNACTFCSGHVVRLLGIQKRGFRPVLLMPGSIYGSIVLTWHSYSAKILTHACERHDHCNRSLTQGASLHRGEPIGQYLEKLSGCLQKPPYTTTYYSPYMLWFIRPAKPRTAQTRVFHSPTHADVPGVQQPSHGHAQLASLSTSLAVKHLPKPKPRLI